MALSSSSSSLVDLSDDRKEVVIKINGQESTRKTEVSSSQPQQQHSNRMNSEKVATSEITSHQHVKEALPMLLRRSTLSTMSTESPNYGQILRREGTFSFNENFGGRGTNGNEQEKVLRCTSNLAFGKNSGLLRTKTKSRLMDSPEHDQQQSRKILNKSYEIGKKDDDPFLEEDFPEEYRKMRFSRLTILELLCLILIVVGFVCTLTIQILKTKTVFDLKLWKWEVMVLVLICGRLVSEISVKIVVFCIERSFMLRKRVCYFVYGLRKAVQNCIWLSLVLVAWLCIFDNKVDKLTNKKVLPYVTRIWICLLVATFVWLLKTLLVKVLAMSFHVSTFFDKIHESLFNQYVIETLSSPPLFASQEEPEDDERVMAEDEKVHNTGPELLSKDPVSIGNTPRKSPILTKTKSGKEQEQEGVTIDQLHRLNQKNISAWKMKRMMNVVRKGMLQSTFDEQLRESVRENESEMQITSETQAKSVATKLFNKVATRELRYICLEDLTDYLSEDEALKTLSLFEGTKNKRISEQAFNDWVVNVFTERRALALSLDDTKTAVKKLHQMLDAVVAVIILVIWLIILRVTTRNFFIFLSSQILLVVFVFGNTCKTTFEAIIFVFVMHPFDVGDRVEVDGVMMLVDEMNILTTVFLRFDNQKIMYPNSVLSTKPIFNYNRSPHTRDTIDFCIHISTPDDKIREMKKAIISHVNSQSDHWHQDPMLFMKDIEDMNGVKWAFWPRHTMNFQNITQRWLRRSDLIEEMIKIFKKIGIEYRMLPHDVNVRNIMPPLAPTRLPSNWTTCT